MMEATYHSANFILMTLCVMLCGYLFWSLRRYARLKTREEDAQTSLQVAIDELQHRVRNNLQVVNSLVQLQTLEAEQRGAESAAQNIAFRVRAVSSAQEITAQTNSDQIAGEALVERIISIHYPQSEPGNHRGKTVWLTPKQATALALVVNEVMMDAKRHRILGAQATLCLKNDQIQLLLIPQSGQEGNGWFSLDSLSTQIIATLVTHDLAGTYQVEAETGRFVLSFPQMLAEAKPNFPEKQPNSTTGKNRNDLYANSKAKVASTRGEETRANRNQRTMRRI